MFTGIVEELGQVRAVQPTGLEVEARTVLEEARLGDSIAINGVCLTTTRLEDGWFAVDTVPETLRRSNLGSLRVGSPVNLERPIEAGGRMGGHFVQGHVEAMARVGAIEPDGEALMVSLQAPAEIMRFVVEKGFVALDGTSLTVVDCNDDSFRVTLIPYTREHTTLGTREVGDWLNIETDILAKYVERLLQPAV